MAFGKAVTGIDNSGSFRVYMGISTGIVQEAKKLHNTSPLATHLLGRALTGTGLMGLMLREPGMKITMQFKGDGPAGQVLCTADSEGHVKGYIVHPLVEMPLRDDGSLDVSGALGHGTVTCIRDMADSKEPYVGKMAAVGASYGGYSVYYLAGVHQKRFSAFIAHAGIYNQEQMYMATEEMWFPDWDNGGCKQPGTYMAGSPWSKNPAAVRHYAQSPHKLAQNWDTPILVIHGELDYRVPVDQGMAAFNTAQMMGVPSKMLLFPDENHWILKPQNSVHWHREFYGWIDKYCR